MATDTKETKQRKGKTNGYKSNGLVAKRDRKRRDAEARQRVYDKLSLTDRIKVAKSRPGNSKRELARLEARLATEKPPVTKTPPQTEGQKAAKAVKRAKAAAEAGKR